MSNALASNAQTPAPGQRISIYRLDTTSLGGQVYFFAEAAKNANGVTFGGQYYTPVDVVFSDFETTTTGGLPQPKLKLSNANGIFQAIVNTYGDLLGCPVSRVRTFAQFLDNGATPDPTAYYGPDSFVIQRKSAENNIFIEWELSAAIDQEGKMLPGRQVIRDTCLWRYRRWTGSAWDYSKAQCPYTGARAYDINNNPVDDPSKDVCNRHNSGCKQRFGGNGILPFGGFPGVARAH